MPVRKYKLKLDRLDCDFLGVILLQLNELQNPPKGLRLEYFIAMEILEKYYEKLTIPRETKMTLTTAQMLALGRLLAVIPIESEVDDTIRNAVLNHIAKQVPWK